MVDPVLNFRRGQIERPAGLGYRGLVLDDLQRQHRLPARRPSFDFLFHHRYSAVFPLQGNTCAGNHWGITCVSHLARWLVYTPETMKAHPQRGLRRMVLAGLIPLGRSLRAGLL